MSDRSPVRCDHQSPSILPAPAAMTSPVKTVRRLANGAVGLAIVGSIGCVWWASRPIDLTTDQTPARSTPSPKISEAFDEPMPEQWMTRRWLSTEKPKTVAVATAPTEPTPAEDDSVRLPWKLVGTIARAGERLAILNDAAGAVAVVGEGDAVSLTPSGGKLERIDNDAVTVQLAGQSTRLTIDRRVETSAANGGGRKRRGVR